MDVTMEDYDLNFDTYSSLHEEQYTTDNNHDRGYGFLSNNNPQNIQNNSKITENSPKMTKTQKNQQKTMTPF